MGIGVLNHRIRVQNMKGSYFIQAISKAPSYNVMRDYFEVSFWLRVKNWMFRKVSSAYDDKLTHRKSSNDSVMRHFYVINIEVH